MKHSIRHHLGLDQARRAAKAALESYKARYAKYHPGGRWVSRNQATVSFKVRGMSFNGTVEVFADRIEMELNAPLIFRPFQKKALQVVESEVRKWIRKAQAGEI